MAAEKQTAASLMAELGSRLEDHRTDPEKVAEWLRFLNSFTDYSTTNKMYIFIQNPQATKVASYKKWEACGRQVKKGERALKVFAPNTFTKKPKPGEEDEQEEKQIVRSFRAIPVFDISQTEGDPIDLVPAVHRTASLDEIAEEMKQVLESNGVMIEPVTATPEVLSAYWGEHNKVLLNEVHSLPLQQVGLVRSVALYHLIENLSDTFKTPLEGPDQSWIANAATWAILHRRGIDADEYTGHLLSSYRGERTVKELLQTADKVIEFIDALDAGIPAEWASAAIKETA